VRQHQQPNIVEEGGEFQIVQLAWGQADCLSDQQRNRSRAATVACLSGECTIDSPADLARRCSRRHSVMPKGVGGGDFSEHGLHRNDPWVDTFTEPLFHRHPSKKNKEPKFMPMILGPL
jgi:hypothetical protein